MKTMRKIQRGISLITAIFLLVVLGMLGTLMVTFFVAQQQSSALDVLGSRAYQASRAGIEWGAYQVLQNPGVGFAPACRAGVANAPVALTHSLVNFGVNVACRSWAASEAGATVTIYQITSVATQGAAGTPDRVERQMTVTIAQ